MTTTGSTPATDIAPSSRWSRVRVLVVAAVVLLPVAGGAAWLLRDGGDDGPDTRLARAVALAPATSARFNWTDWSAIREEVDVDLDASSPVDDVRRFLDAGYDADLTSTSALLHSAETLHAEYGVSPATLDWELFAQGDVGAIVLMGLPDSLDLDDLRRRLAELGYTEPDEADGVWLGGADLLARIGETAPTPELGYLVIDEERQMLAASDSDGFLADWQGDLRGSDVDDGVADVVAATGDAVSATVYTGDHACAALSMAQADPTDRTRAAQLIAEAGEVSPISGFAIAALPSGDLRVAMAFENDEHARRNADVRSVLASGPAPGQGGDFADRFALGSVGADGTVVTMELLPEPHAFVLSDLATGPVLFATC